MIYDNDDPRLTAYALGELEPSETAEVERLLADERRRPQARGRDPPDGPMARRRAQARARIRRDPLARQSPVDREDPREERRAGEEPPLVAAARRALVDRGRPAGRSDDRLALDVGREPRPTDDGDCAGLDCISSPAPAAKRAATGPEADVRPRRRSLEVAGSSPVRLRADDRAEVGSERGGLPVRRSGLEGRSQGNVTVYDAQNGQALGLPSSPAPSIDAGAHGRDASRHRQLGRGAG